MSSRGISVAVKPDIMGVAGANMQRGHFVCPSCSQKKENTVFQLVLRSAWGVLSPGKQVASSSIQCRKRSQVWDRESEWQLRYLQQRHKCWKWEEF